MEENAGRIIYLIEKLRSITLAVQVVPFAFSALYIICMFLYLTMPENICGVLDTLFYVSPTTVAGMLIFSRILKLCKWHKLACALPVVPQIAVFIDYHVVSLSRVGAILSITLSAVMAGLLLVAAWNVFLKPKHNVRRKETPDRNFRLLQDEAAE